MYGIVSCVQRVKEVCTLYIGGVCVCVYEGGVYNV